MLEPLSRKIQADVRAADCRTLTGPLKLSWTSASGANLAHSSDLKRGHTSE